jgi:prephenate dehydrogenase
MPGATRRITILGLGLIGGSLGLALRAANRGWEVVGQNRSHEAASKAKKAGAVDRAEWNLPNAVDGASVVVLAVAPNAIEQVMRDIAPHLAPGTVVTDVASTKVQVMAWANEILPPHVHFVGGHPMAGKEKAGIDAAEATLFRNATWCILPGDRCAPEAVTLVEEIVRSVGAQPYYLDAAEHDSYVAAISHVPFISAATLVGTVAGSPSWRDMQRMAAGGFRDATRTASGDVAMHRDICMTNREAISRWLERYIDELQRFRDMLGGSSEQVEQYFVEAKVARDKWMESRGSAEPPVQIPPMPSAREGMMDLFLGRRRGSLPDAEAREDRRQ